MMLSELQIKLAELEKITAPALTLAGDHDMIPGQHALDIFHHIPRTQLQIFASAKHMIPFDDPDRFNAIVDKFLTQPFVRIDRIGDVMKSLEKLRAAPAN